VLAGVGTLNSTDSFSHPTEYMATYSITLSRAHKLAERLKARAAELSAAAVENAGAVPVHGKTGTAAQIEALQARDAAAATALDECLSVHSILGNVRQAIGRANASFGVSDMLTEQAVLSAQLASIKAYLDAAKRPGIRPHEVATWEPMNRGEFGVRAVEVQATTPEKVAHYEAVQRQLQARLYALSDDISAANAKKISVELPESLAKLVGLA